MREILFRGKRMDNGEWVKGMPCSDLKGGVDSIQSNIGGGIFDVIPETIGQYTGLKDKNGKRIFEGDIVKLWRSVCAKGDYRMEYRCPLAVEYCDLWAQFVVSDNPNKEQYSIYNFEGIEVIGNIHDNPELLEDT